MRGPGGRLRAQIDSLSAGLAVIESHCETPWASVTFSGARHSMVLQFAGIEAVAAGDLLIARLSEHEFAIPGQLVADAAVIEAESTLLPVPTLRVRIEILLLEES